MDNKKVIKRLVLSLFLFFVCLASNAQQVSESNAFQKAREFMKEKRFSTPSKARSRGLGETNSNGFYVFNADDGGFVIVAGDERMPDILGYSDHGRIDVETAPCGLRWLLGCYEQMSKSENLQSARSRTRAAKAPVAPFIATTWGQKTPYNAMCPKIDGARAVTGCVATAMAQILNYYRWPNDASKPIPAYTSYTNKVSMPQLEPTTFTWGHLNKADLSKLMLYCGQAVQMDYGPEESGAGVIDEALKSYFDYDESLRLVSRDNHSNDDWNDMLYEELVAQRPIYYFGSDGKDGHAFILCGYKDERFYINWGWDGGADGFFILDGISPALGGYNLGQGAVIGIKPKGTPTPLTFYPRRVVMENYAWTGVGAHEGRNVMGIETMRRLSNEYPDNFIGIDTHASDEMSNPENYQYMLSKYTCFPRSYIDRVSIVDPYYSDVKYIVETQKNSACAKVEATASYAKPDFSAIKVSAKSTFGFDGNDEDFGLAFVLLEDQVGPFEQYNGLYSNPSAPDNPDDWLNEWVHQGQIVRMLFDNVAKGIYGDARGNEGSLPATIERGKTYNFEYSFNVPSSSWKSNKDNYRVVVLLIDRTTGEIMNACQTKIDYDDNVKNLTFEFKNKNKSLATGSETCWKSKGIAEENLSISTNNDLVLATFDGKNVSGKAKLEILNNTMEASTLVWKMGDENTTVTGNSAELSFTTKSSGRMTTQLTASNIVQFGQLIARLTATVDGVSQSVIIKFIHRQLDAQIGEGIALTTGQSWWNNATVNSYDGSPVGYMQGTKKEERYSVATYIPVNLLGDKIPTIDGVSFFCPTPGMANVEAWISTHLPENGEKADIATIHYPDDELLLEKWNYMVFHQHYQIPDGGVYVGYSFDIVDMNSFRSLTPVMFSDKTRDNALWLKTESMSAWIDRFDNLQGNLQLKILFGGNALKKNAVSISKVQPVYTLTNTSTPVPFVLHNDGSEPVRSIKYEGDFGEGEFLVNLAPYSSSDGYLNNLTFSSGNEAKYQLNTLKITKVNGNPNETTESSMKIPVFVSKKESPTKVVLEEFTGTWCGFSTQANLLMDELRKKFGESIITICVHGGNDPMLIPEYSDVRTLNGGAYPSLLINRQGNGNDDAWTPFFDCDIDYFVSEAFKVKMPGSIEVGAEWTNESREAINIHTRTTFEVKAQELPFQISYVLLEDGMTGKGNEWAQNNVYSGIEDIYDRRLEELTKLPAMIYGQKYNDVPVAAWDVYKGVKGSLTGPFSAGVPVKGTFVADIKDNKLIQNKENLSVVALIVNKETGKIINAAKCKIGNSPSGINNATTNEAAFDIYTLSGLKIRSHATSLEGLPKGVYIINGKKIIK